MAEAGALVLLIVVLAVAGLWDWRTRLVPNWLTYPAMVLGMVWWGLWGWLGGEVDRGVIESLVGLGAGLIPFAVIFAAGGLGGGDVKLMGAVGALSAHWECVLAGAFYAFVIGALMAVVLMARHGLIRQTLGRIFQAALAGASRTKVEEPVDSPRVPFGMAIAFGAVLAGLEVLAGLPTPWATFIG